MTARLSAVLPYWLDRPALEALDIARAADRLGFEELWVGEMATFDAFALAGAIARETAGLRLVVGPLAVGVRTPVALALGLGAVALLGGRPAGLALGASNPLIVEGWHGRPWRPVEARARETIEALRPILAAERSGFDGDHVRTHGFRLREAPAPTELALAAFGPRMIAAGAQLADRVVVNLLTPEQVARVSADIEAAARAAGRPAPPLTAWVPAALEPGPAALAQLAGQLAVYLPAPGYGEMFAQAGFEEVVALARSGIGRRDLQSAIPAGLVGRVCVMGDAPQIASGLAEYVAAGADTVAVVPATAQDPAGERVLAAVAGAARDP